MQKLMKKFIQTFVLTLTLVSSLCLMGCFQNAGATSADDAASPTISAAADISQYLNVTILDDGVDIYSPFRKQGGYHYGPSIIVTADGSIDVWFSAPGAKGEWDWITYRHSSNGGRTWTKEKKVLSPTAGSRDLYSTCDPGVVKVGDYYYIGYTSTTNAHGLDNNVFVARSKNPDGPYEKWNGRGWGGNPKPIVTYNGDATAYGAGEPSFVVMGDELYIYYTWRDIVAGASVNETRLAIADAADENWPATMQAQGVAIEYENPDCDSADVKYVEDYGKLIAISTSQRFTDNSSVSIYESNDGRTFTKVNDLRSHISYRCHNSGISSRSNGHISLSDKNYIAYAYGVPWLPARWATRMHEIDISLSDAPDFSDAKKNNVQRDATYRYHGPFTWHSVGITVGTHVYSSQLGGSSFFVELFKVDEATACRRIFFPVKFSNYDENIITIKGLKIAPIGVGSTFVTATWQGMSVEFLVKVY